MKILLFAGSLRSDSLNKKVVKFTEKMLQKNTDLETVYVDLQPLNFPVYDGDIEALGIPENITGFAKKIGEADAIIISSPEYNGSMSSPLKNTLDWISRVKPMPLVNKPILLLGASPGALGATRGLGHARQPIEVLGNFLYPQSMGFMQADRAFDENGDLKDPALVEKLNKLVNSFIVYAKKLK